MNLSAENQLRLAQAAGDQADYRPSEAIQQQLKNKSLVMVVAPTSMGKTYIMKAAAELDEELHRVCVFTTREPRPDDQSLFRYIQPTDEELGPLLDKIEAHEIVQYGIHPTKGTIYGTELSDHAGAFNLLATLANSAKQLQSVGFSSTPLIGLVADTHTWQNWFTQRYPEASEERTARLKEALQSIEWLLAQSDVHWLINRSGESEKVARELITIIKTNEAISQNTGQQYAKAIREHIVELLK